MNIFLNMAKAIDGTGTFAFMLFLLTVLLFAFMFYMIMYVIRTRHFIKMIGKMHTCNDCGRKQCEHRPAWGDYVRYNCPFWEETKSTTTWSDVPGR